MGAGGIGTHSWHKISSFHRGGVLEQRAIIFNVETFKFYSDIGSLGSLHFPQTPLIIIIHHPISAMLGWYASWWAYFHVFPWFRIDDTILTIALCNEKQHIVKFTFVMTSSGRVHFFSKPDSLHTLLPEIDGIIEMVIRTHWIDLCRDMKKSV